MKLKPLEYALYLLKLRDRSVGEIRHKMALKGHDKDKIEEVILFLTDKKFLDDERFVDNFIKQQQLLSSIGKFKLKQKLTRLFVGKNLINTALSAISEESEEDRAIYIANRWLERKKSITKESRYNKLGQFLAGRGFSYEIIKTVLNRVLKSH